MPKSRRILSSLTWLQWNPKSHTATQEDHWFLTETGEYLWFPAVTQEEPRVPPCNSRGGPTPQLQLERNMKIPDATQEEPLVTRLNSKAGLTPVATRENPKFPTATQQVPWLHHLNTTWGLIHLQWHKRTFKFPVTTQVEHSPIDATPEDSQEELQFSSVARSCPTLRPMNHSTPGLPVHHQFPFTQTHVHWVGDAIQPSHPLSSPSPPAPNPSQHQGLF